MYYFQKSQLKLNSEIYQKCEKIFQQILIKIKGKITQRQRNDQEQIKAKVLQASGIVGIVYIENQSFLVYVENVFAKCIIKDYHDVYEVANINYEPIMVLKNEVNNKYEFKYNRELTFQQKEILTDKKNQIAKIFQTGFYFSLSYPLTLSKQKINMNKDCDQQFCWNYEMLSEFRKSGIHQSWLVQYIQGYVGHFDTKINNIQFYLISRRAWNRGGTRYNHRGADDQGHTSNYVETEQLLIQKEKLGNNTYYNFNTVSYVQIRGSIPLVWSQKGYTKSELFYEQNQNIQKNTFNLHFGQLIKDYQKVLCLNLLQMQNESEYFLTKEYENHIKNNKDLKQYLNYQYFDFHDQCKGNNYKSIDKLLYTLQPTIKGFNLYYEKYEGESTQIQLQQGVVRTNCLDCLDRTNVIMMKIGALALSDMFLVLNYNLKEKQLSGINILEHLDINSNLQNTILINFKHQWADMGDNISQQYAGTGASTTQITKTGQAGMFEKSFKGIQRFYKQNFEDDFKQECYKIIWGRNKPDQADQELEEF
ncbi:hypothetical protein PPERSA_04208 [Pseudocohnilembus persalinus]|uniref:SAC domain-containing protein n=1 Tax=Pseudocohnilembus persalinus TaxID=266149 RepID=A0A0V0QNL3_PSEPJ|nr:hypothetical protein PPERSA_04208 [Pseudocohnilembus persalinus]|eukprot:KRX03656.1 hypothetical protein PPERSA_04208 [Pseudocohnilembus persalinus]